MRMRGAHSLFVSCVEKQTINGKVNLMIFATKEARKDERKKVYE